MGRRAVYDMINKFSRDHGIIMSTHLIGEAEAVAEKVLLINKGRILALDSVRNLLGKFAQYEYIGSSLKKQIKTSKLIWRIWMSNSFTKMGGL